MDRCLLVDASVLRCHLKTKGLPVRCLSDRCFSQEVLLLSPLQIVVNHIVTTHDSNIMDLDFVRQDEIWFIERQKDHSSKLYSLNKFRARFDKKIEKDYLLGRYGAIPIFRQVALESDAMEEGEQDAETI